ncbi:histone-like nucleoid-structuring protein Lsr2 [Mycobacterium sp. 360MFTsu5.1]|uniref:Lsr2 dimerization domain-containing protein n=1 Tax=Mycobacterium sp. 360MFTsu5.1 TaxID=1172186 RepID=UPI0009DBDFF1|nr:histone-like nucleoid-structuring protein Lsr2 [Mycobacterium sp. 360MFTsu5.1]
MEVNVPVAKLYSTVWTDDLDGSLATTTLELTLDGITYAIDLSEENAVRMRSVLEPYIRAASRAGRRGRRTNWPVDQVPAGNAQSPHQRAREWLRMNGHEVGSRGRLSRELLQRYESSQGACLLGG